MAQWNPGLGVVPTAVAGLIPDSKTSAHRLINALLSAERAASKVPPADDELTKYMLLNFDHRLERKKAARGRFRTATGGSEPDPDDPEGDSEGGHKRSLRSFYSTYTPDGILKVGWWAKHTERLPAVLVLLAAFDMDVGFTEWAQREGELCERLERTRDGLEGRTSVKIMLVLLQASVYTHDWALRSAPPAPLTLNPVYFRTQERNYPREMEAAGKAEQAQERISSLRRRADLDHKSVVLLYSADLDTETRALTSVVRTLQKRLGDLCGEYYHSEAKRIKGYRTVNGHATSAGALALKVRHNFKVGFYYEVRRVPAKALRHYISAYKAVEELAGAYRASPGDFPYTAHEVKCVAEWVHLRLCVQHVVVASPPNLKALVAQFTVHVRTGRALVGVPILEFRHWAWLARQFRTMADVLVRVRPSLALDRGVDRRLCDPAARFLSAALHGVRRREAAQRAALYGGGADPSTVEARQAARCAALSATNTTITPSSYVGAPPVVTLSVDFDGVDAAGCISEALMSHLAVVEGAVDQSAVVLDDLIQARDLLVSKGVSCGQPKRRQQLRLQLMVAEEHMHSGKLDSAIAALENVLVQYRAEQWSAIQTRVLRDLVDCYKTRHFLPAPGSVPTAVPDTDARARRATAAAAASKLELELLSPVLAAHTSVSERKTAQLALLAWSALAAREGNAGAVKASLGGWQGALPPVVAWSVAFVYPEALVGTTAAAVLTLTSQFPLSLRVFRVDLGFDDERYDLSLCQDDHGVEIVLEPAVAKTVTFELSVHSPCLQPKDDTAVSPTSPHGELSLKCTSAVLHVADGENQKVQPWLSIALAPPLAHEIPVALPPQSRLPAIAAARHLMNAGDRGAASRATVATHDSLRVLLPAPRVSLHLNFAPPALTGEIYGTTLVIRNDFGGTVDMDNPALTLQCWPPPLSEEEGFFLSGESEDALELGDDMQPTNSAVAALAKLSPRLEENEQQAVQLRLLFRPGAGLIPSTDVDMGLSGEGTRPMRTLAARLEYGTRLENGALCRISTEATFELPCSDPFRARFRCSRHPGRAEASSLFEKEGSPSTLVLGKPVILAIELCCTAPAPAGQEDEACATFELVELSLQPAAVVDAPVANALGGQPRPLLRHGDSFSAALTIVPRVEGSAVPLGTLAIKWRRGGHGGGSRICSTTLDAPLVCVQKQPLSVGLSTHPLPWAKIGVPMDMVATLANNTRTLHRISVALDLSCDDVAKSGSSEGSMTTAPTLLPSSRGFVVCGPNKVVVTLHPLETRTVVWTLVPLHEGHQRLPRMQMRATRNNILLVDASDTRVIFVRPSDSYS